MTLEAGKLTKQARDALPAEHFAVPGKRKLPIHDERHVRLGWDMVDRTSGLTDEERSAARRHILRRARELGIDTKDWHKGSVQALSIEAMSLNISNDGGHPNKLPFSGVLTRLDEPSDEPPSGSGGKRTILTTAAAEQALESLLGMAVNFTPHLDGHDPQAKIALITAANIEGTEVRIDGFIYAADFPEVATLIRQRKDELGFSFEAQQIFVTDPSADPLVIESCVFTGAAILRKDKAAYQTTSIAASTAAQEIDVTKEELEAVLASSVAAALKPISDRLDKIEAGSKTADVSANAANMALVEPHAKALESCAGAMEMACIGNHPQYGHAAVLRRMAGCMRAEAAIGKVPHIYRDHDWPMVAGADTGKVDTKAIQDAVEAATKPLVEQVATQKTQIEDLKAAARASVPAPERKTLQPHITALLARGDLSIPADGGKFDVAAVDAALTKANLTTAKRIEVKTSLTHSGLL